MVVMAVVMVVVTKNMVEATEEDMDMEADMDMGEKHNTNTQQKKHNTTQHKSTNRSRNSIEAAYNKMHKTDTDVDVRLCLLIRVCLL